MSDITEGSEALIAEMRARLAAIEAEAIDRYRTIAPPAPDPCPDHPLTYQRGYLRGWSDHKAGRSYGAPGTGEAG